MLNMLLGVISWKLLCWKLLKRILGAMLINIDDIEVIEAHSRRMDG